MTIPNKVGRVFSALRLYQLEFGYSPYLRDLAQDADLGVITTIDALKYMVEAGMVRHIPRRPRGYYIPGYPNQYEEVTCDSLI